MYITVRYNNSRIVPANTYISSWLKSKDILVIDMWNTELRWQHLANTSSKMVSDGEFYIFIISDNIKRFRYECPEVYVN